jgi:hypothetical protein
MREVAGSTPGLVSLGYMYMEPIFNSAVHDFKPSFSSISLPQYIAR